MFLPCPAHRAVISSSQKQCCSQTSFGRLLSSSASHFWPGTTADLSPHIQWLPVWWVHLKKEIRCIIHLYFITIHIFTRRWALSRPSAVLPKHWENRTQRMGQMPVGLAFFCFSFMFSCSCRWRTSFLVVMAVDTFCTHCWSPSVHSL